jgi:hypothetical protein
MSADAVTSIVLRGYPVRVGQRQQEHLDEVRREFQLLALSRPEVRDHVPGRLLELVDTMSVRFSRELEEPRRVREQAVLDGVEQVDLVYPAVPGAAEVMTTWWNVMREVDVYCSNDELLSLATPPDVLALQRWVVSEIVAQAAGAAPTRWAGPPED